MVYLEGYYLVSKYVQIYADFPDMFLALISNLNPVWPENYFVWLEFFWIYSRLSYDPAYGLSWWMSYMSWKELYSAWGGEFYNVN